MGNGKPLPTLQEAIVGEARSWIGTPYHHQASLKGVGCDCIGLVRGVWRAVIGPEPQALPAYSGDWGEATGAESLLELGRRHFTPVAIDQLAPGDVVAFRIKGGRVAKHCGIVTADGRFVHAQERVPVSEVALSDWWRRRIAGVFRFPCLVVIARLDPTIHSGTGERDHAGDGMGPRVGAARRPRMTGKGE